MQLSPVSHLVLRLNYKALSYARYFIRKIEKQEDGLQIVINNKCYNIFLIQSLVIGDNLGVTSMFGFVESFTSSFYCRICYVHSNDAKTLIKENESLFRTKEK